MSLSVADLKDWASQFESALPDGRNAEADAERIDLLRSLEELKGTIEATQAHLAVALDASQRAQQAAAGVPTAQRGRGVAAQIALARRESPHRAGILLGLAKILHAEMPHTLAALSAGRLTEHRATILVRETACLSLEDRTSVDAELCAEPETLDGVGTGALIGRLRARAAELDAAAVVRRHAQATNDRRVSLRPAPDAMTYLTALLPVAQGVACLKALQDAAASATSAGDPRSRGQIQADTLVERITGQANADDVSFTLDLILSDATLVGGDLTPGMIPGYGAIPAEIARNLAAHAISPTNPAAAWIRKLYANTAGELVAMTSRARCFSGALADFIGLRDQGICATPYCDAPIRHLDHIQPHHAGGPTTAHNGQGLCEACNHAKQAIGWTQRRGRARDVITIAPTGHTYQATAPPPPTPATTTPALEVSIPEWRFQVLIA